MSNQNLIARIHRKLSEFRLQRASCADLAHILRHEGKALEALPYDLIQQIDSLASDFELAQWAIEEGCLPDTTSLIAQTEVLLDKINTASDRLSPPHSAPPPIAG